MENKNNNLECEKNYLQRVIENFKPNSIISKFLKWLEKLKGGRKKNDIMPIL